MNRKCMTALAGLIAATLWSANPGDSAASSYIEQGPANPFRSFEDDRGGFYMTWINRGVDNEWALRAQHMDPEGHALWESGGVIVSSSVTSAEDWSGLADGKGGLTLFWDERDGVHAQRLLSDGERLRPGTSVLMSTSTAIQPDAVPDALGGTLVVWREILPSGRSVVMAQRVDPNGKPLWPRGGLRVSLRTSNQTNPRVVYDNMSGMIVAWRDEANNASELRVQRVDFSGNRLWSLDGLKITAPIGAADFPTIAPLGTGEVVIAWMGSVNQTNQIFLQKVGPESVLKWGTGASASNVPAAYNQWNPILLGDEEGGTWIAWEDYRSQVNYQIELNYRDRASSSVWTNGEIAVAPVAGDQGKMTLMADGNDGVWCAWIDNRLATIGLYVQEVDEAGTRLQGPAGRLIANRLSKPSIPQLVSLAPGKAAIVWSDQPKRGKWTLSWEIIGPPK